MRRLTFSDGDETAGSWSPDGTRIVFVRRFTDLRTPEICWITVDGRLERCHRPEGHVVDSVRGWHDSRRVLAGTDSAGQPLVVLIDVDDWRIERSIPVSSQVTVSPDGRWIARRSDLHGYGSTQIVVQDVDGRGGPRVVIGVPEGQSMSLLTWRPSSATPRYVANLEVQPSVDTLPVGVPTQLRARAVDVSGRPVALPPVLSWTASDPRVATIDQNGLLRPGGVGAVRVRVSAGGWRQATTTFVVAPSTVRQLFTEDWTGAPDGRWRMFGEPRPAVTEGPGGVKAFWNRGDGQFESGAYSLHEFDAAHGLGVEAKVSIKVTSSQWQFLHVSLEAVSDTARLNAWDHSTGSPPEARPQERCRLRYPGEESALGKGFALVHVGDGGVKFSIPDELAAGEWQTVRLQLLPDGRCGIAINGEPRWLSSGAVTLDRPYRVFIHGKSVNTKVLVGTVEVWQGVKNDVSWESVGRELPPEARARSPSSTAPSSSRSGTPITSIR